MDHQDLQGNYFELLKKTSRPNPPNNVSLVNGYEVGPAHAYLAKLLRNYADQIERGHSPYVYGYFEEKEGPFWELHVLLSHPWGG